MKLNLLKLGLLIILFIPMTAVILYASPNEPEGYKTHFDLVIDEGRKQLYGSSPFT